jgi:hypothetical protein
MEANSSGTIDFDRFNLTVVTVNIECDGTTADFAILNRGKRPGRSVDNRGEDSSAVRANYLGLYLKVHARPNHNQAPENSFILLPLSNSARARRLGIRTQASRVCFGCRATRGSVAIHVQKSRTHLREGKERCAQDKTSTTRLIVGNVACARLAIFDMPG